MSPSWAAGSAATRVSLRDAARCCRSYWVLAAACCSAVRSDHCLVSLGPSCLGTYGTRFCCDGAPAPPGGCRAAVTRAVRGTAGPSWVLLAAWEPPFPRLLPFFWIFANPGWFDTIPALVRPAHLPDTRSAARMPGGSQNAFLPRGLTYSIPISFSAFGQRSPENLGFSESLCAAHTAPERTPLAGPAAPGPGLDGQPSAEATGQHSARKRPVKKPDFSKTLKFFDFHPQFLHPHSTTAGPCAMPGKSMESSICQIFLLRYKGLCKEKTHLENAHFGEKHSAQKQQELRLQPSMGSKTG